MDMERNKGTTGSDTTGTMQSNTTTTEHYGFITAMNIGVVIGSGIFLRAMIF